MFATYHRVDECFESLRSCVSAEITSVFLSSTIGRKRKCLECRHNHLKRMVTRHYKGEMFALRDTCFKEMTVVTNLFLESVVTMKMSWKCVGWTEGHTKWKIIAPHILCRCKQTSCQERLKFKHILFITQQCIAAIIVGSPAAQTTTIHFGPTKSCSFRAFRKSMNVGAELWSGMSYTSQPRTGDSDGRLRMNWPLGQLSSFWIASLLWIHFNNGLLSSAKITLFCREKTAYLLKPDSLARAWTVWWENWAARRLPGCTRAPAGCTAHTARDPPNSNATTFRRQYSGRRKKFPQLSSTQSEGETTHNERNASCLMTRSNQLLNCSVCLSAGVSLLSLARARSDHLSPTANIPRNLEGAPRWSQWWHLSTPPLSSRHQEPSRALLVALPWALQASTTQGGSLFHRVVLHFYLFSHNYCKSIVARDQQSSSP